MKKILLLLIGIICSIDVSQLNAGTTHNELSKSNKKNNLLTIITKDSLKLSESKSVQPTMKKQVSFSELDECGTPTIQSPSSTPTNDQLSLLNPNFCEIDEYVFRGHPTPELTKSLTPKK